MSQQQRQSWQGNSSNYPQQYTFSQGGSNYTSAPRESGGTQPSTGLARNYGDSMHGLNQTGTRGQYGGAAQGHAAVEHIWVEQPSTTPDYSLSHLIREIERGGVMSFFCGCEGCKYPVGFARRAQVIAHIRSVHMHERLFLCTTCNATFERRQDADRHGTSASSSRVGQYMCSGCERMFPRKQYRDAHEETCLSQDPGTPSRNPVGRYRE